MATFKIRNGRVTAVVREQGGNACRTFSSRSAAKKWASRIEHELEVTEVASSFIRSKTTVSEAIERYERECLLDLRSARDRRSQLKIWKGRIGNVRLRDITAAMMSEAREAKRHNADGSLKGNTNVNRITSANTAVFEKCVKDWQLMRENPCRKLSRLKEPPVRIPGHDASAAFLRNFTLQYRARANL